MLLLSNIFLFLISSFSYSQELVSYLPKQPIDTLLFANEQSLSYSQRKNGELILTKNFKTETLIDQKENLSNYTISSSFDEKKIAIELDQNPHTYFGFKKENEIYSSTIGSLVAKLEGKGISPKLHLDDQWLSYFSPIDNHLILRFLPHIDLKHTIKLKNKYNGYFIPEILGINSENFLYTDYSENGEKTAVLFNHNSKKFFVVYKSIYLNSRIEFCKINQMIYLAEWSEQENKIYQINYIKSPSMQNPTVIYKNKLFHQGSLVCDSQKNRIYFIRADDEVYQNDYYKSSLVFIDTDKLIEKKVKKSLDINSVFNMGKIIMAKINQQYYVIKD